MPTVKLYAGLRSTAGMKEIRLDGDRLKDVLQALNERFPAFKQTVFDGETCRPHIVITINGSHVNPEHGFDIPLASDDQIAIFPPIAGG